MLEVRNLIVYSFTQSEKKIFFKLQLYQQIQKRSYLVKNLHKCHLAEWIKQQEKQNYFQPHIKPSKNSLGNLFLTSAAK